MPAPHESIWGSINTCFEIGIEIYQLFCKAQNGENKSGISIPIDRAKEILSEKALSLGAEKDGFIHFESPNQILAPLFELLKSAAITDEDVNKTFGNLAELEQLIKAVTPEYMGSLPLPDAEAAFDKLTVELSPPESERTVKEIRSGLSIVKDEENHFFVAVHKTLAERDLTPTALKYADRLDDFYFYGAIACAIPIYELARKYPEINDIVRNNESLIQTMVTKAPNYVADWNANHAEPGEKIKPNGSIPMMFLQEHYDFEADRTRTAVADFIEKEKAHEREADTGFEQLDEEWELER